MTDRVLKQGSHGQSYVLESSLLKPDGLRNYLTRSWEDSVGDREVIQVRDGGGMDVMWQKRQRREGWDEEMIRR